MLASPTAISTGEGAAISFTGAKTIHITDAENDNVSVTVAAAHGTLTAGSPDRGVYHADRQSDGCDGSVGGAKLHPNHQLSWFRLYLSECCRDGVE